MSFCRITGRSRGLPKPNYFPLLAPISPADAKRCCRITGKSYGLPTHHYIPVLLTARSGKNKCKITNVSGELGPHHYSPEINYGNRKHVVLPDFRYIFPVLDGSTEAQRGLIDMLSTKQVVEDKRYVYTVQERKCSLVFSARMEAAVRDGDVRDVMLAKDSDTVLIKMKQGRSVSMDFKDFTEDVEMFEGEGPSAEVLKQREMEELEEKKKKRKRAAGLSSMKKIFENKEILAEEQELVEEKLRQERLAKKAKLEEIKHEKCDLKSYSSKKFSAKHMRSKSSIIACSEEWRDQMHPLIETWDQNVFEVDKSYEVIKSSITELPQPVNIAPYHCDSPEIYEIDKNISEVSVSLDSVPCVNPLKYVKSRPSQVVLEGVKELTNERLDETSNVSEKLLEANKLEMLPTLETLPDVVKNIRKGKKEKLAKVAGLTVDINKAKKFVPGQHINTPQGPVFVPGQTVDTPAGPVFVPGLTVNTPLGPALLSGHIVDMEGTNEPFFLAGQVLKTQNGEEFVCGQTVKNKDQSYKFVEGQTVVSEEGLKFIPGKILHHDSEEVFVPGQTIMTPEGVQFVPGQTITENNGVIFTPGQNAKINNEWQFVPGQVIQHDDKIEFVPGATLATPNGLKFVPGQTVSTNGEITFVPGISRMENDILQFVPGTTVETVDGPKFMEGQIVNTEYGQKFMPGKTIVKAEGHVEFSVAKSIDEICFTEETVTGLPIDIKSTTVSEESLYVFGHMIQTAKGIEFYPGTKVPDLEGKVVPGRLVKSETAQSRFVPGMMIEGVFVPGQVVFTENGEQFVPGQVVETAEGPKFVPGQVVNTKSGPKFVPGQTIHTIDGPRFVPGQIIDTKAGPTFIPGQVIYTEDEGSRFVPGQVVDTDEGPRFVPGRVVETDNQGVTFVPGQIVQTPEGLKFVAPDLIEGEEGLEFSVQSFVVTPEELKLLKVKTNPNDTTSTKGELTIDSSMFKQLSEAGMSIGRQVPTDLPAVQFKLLETKNTEALQAFVSEFGLKDDVANQLMEVIKSIIGMGVHIKCDMETKNMDPNKTEGKRVRTNKKTSEAKNVLEGALTNEEMVRQENVKNSIAAAVLAALVTAEQFEENKNNGKEKYQYILKSIDTILGKAINEDLVSAMYKILQTEEEKENLRDEILENTSQPKVELIKIALNGTLPNFSVSNEEIVEKISTFLCTENEVLGLAFKNISKYDTKLMQEVLEHISNSISFVSTKNEDIESIQQVIVSAIQEDSQKSLENVLNISEQGELKELISQSIGLARVLGMSDAVKHLQIILNDDQNISKISEDTMSMNILKRLTVMKKLADQSPSLQSAISKLGTDLDLARVDPQLRELVRESAALMIIPEKSPLLSSEEVPLSLLQPENSLAMEDFLYQRKTRSGALLIMKKGLQAVVPREASRSVLTGEVAYTVLDENGISHFEPLHVFSALNLSTPTAHRFSMYSCPIVDNDDEDLQTFTGYCNISNNQRITRLGGWNRRYSGVLLDRENTRSRMSYLDNTPSYRRYPYRETERDSLSRSRSSCSRSPPKVDDVVVATSDYTAAADDEVSIKAGDIVEVLDTKAALGSKNERIDSLDVEADLLDVSAAKHKRTVRPRRNHPSKQAKRAPDARWLVRVVEDVQDGELRTRQGYVPANLLKEKLPERDMTALAARRQAVVRELIETEEEFGRDMQQVVNQYMRPMDKATTPKPVFDNRELLFSNFKQICEFHNTSLLEGIKYYAGEPRMLGRALLRMEREFDKHVAYCRDEPRAQYLLAENPVVAEYFQTLADKLGDDKGLTEHLKLPIQRINDYQLLLKELVKYSQRLGDDCADLQKALELFLGVPTRATNNKFIASIEGYRGNIYKLGRLLTHDWFTVDEGKIKDRYLFLFKARILICKVKRVGDDRSVFVLKNIVKLPEVEVKDYPGTTQFELHQKTQPEVLVLNAHKEHVKAAWLKEIRQYATDVVALAEHAADDLQILSPPQISSPPPEEKRKRDSTEEDEQRQEKKSRLEETEIAEALSKEEAVQLLSTKRKASLESDIAKKVAKAEVSEVSSVAEVQETLSSHTVQSNVEIVQEFKTFLAESTESQSIVQTCEAASISSTKEKSQTNLEQQISISESEAAQSIQSSLEQQTQRSSVQETSQTEVVSKSESAQTASAAVTETKSAETFSVEKQDKVSNGSSKRNSKKSTDAAKPAKVPEESSQLNTNKTDVSLDSKETKEFTVEKKESSEVVEKAETKSDFEKTTEKTELSLEKATVETSQEEQAKEVKTEISSSVIKTDELVTQISTEKEVKSEDKTSDSKKRLSVNDKSEEKTVSQEKAERVDSVTENQTTVTQEVVSDKVTTAQAEVTQSSKQVIEESQTATAGETADEEMSRYSRSSRLSGEYSSSTSRRLSSGGRYESSSTYDTSSGIASSYSRRQSGARVESEITQTGGAIEGSTRYESKYSSSRIEGGSKYGIESSVESESKLGSIASKYGITGGSDATVEGSSTKYSIESTYDGNDTTSKIDSIASKYGRNSITDSSSAETRTTKLKVDSDAAYDGSVETMSKIDSIASKYGRNSITENGKSEIRSTRLNIEMSSDGDSVETSSNLQSKYSKRANGESVQESVFTSSSLFNGSTTPEKSRGRPIFSKTLEGQNIELTPEERKQKAALNAPYFIVALKDTEILLNTYLRFMVKVKGDPNPDVKFYRDGKEITTTSESDRVSIVRIGAERGCYELVIADVNANDAGKYSCKAINIYGECECEATVAVVDDKNIFGELPPGGEGLLTKGEKPVFIWKKDGKDFEPEERFKVLLCDDEDSLALVFQHVKPEDAGLYTCVAKTSTGNISCSAELTVQGAVNVLHREPQKPQLVIEHREAIVASGASAMLELVCKGYPKPNVVFKHEGKLVEADARHKFLYEDTESMSLVIKNVTQADAGEYQVTASNELGEDTTTMNLIVKAAPKIKKKIENQTCMAGSEHTVTIQIEGTPSPDVTFYKDGVEIKSSERIVIVKESEEIYKITIKDAKLTDTGSYSVVAKNEINQCSDFWQWNVTSPPKIIKTLGSNKVCEEKETVTFEVRTEAEPAPTVTWFKNKTEEVKESSVIKISSSGESHKMVITSAERSDAGEYSCEIRNVHGSASDSSILNVRCGPVFTQRLTNTTAREGDVNVEFTVDVEAFPEPTVKWYLGDVEITEKKSIYTRVDNGSSHKLILKEVSAELSGQYTCKVSNDLGSDSCQATFTVNRKPRITKSLVDMTVDAGQTLKLEVEVEGCPEPRIKWYKDGKEVTTDARIRIERDTQRLENYNLTVTLVKEEDGGDYEVIAENEFGSVSSKSTVTVHTKEVHSRFKKETVAENMVEDLAEEKQPDVQNIEDNKNKLKAKKSISIAESIDENDGRDGKSKTKTVVIEEVNQSMSYKAEKSTSEPESAEEKSFWDDNGDDGRSKTIKVESVQQSMMARKTITQSETVEEKSFWDDKDDDEKSKQAKIEFVRQSSKTANKSFTEPEVAEEKSFWDDNDENKKPKQAKVEYDRQSSKTAEKTVIKPEIAEEKSFWDNDENEKPKQAKKDYDRQSSKTADILKSEVADEKSIWDDKDEDEKSKQTKIEYVRQTSKSASKSITEPETAEEKSFWDDNDEGKPKQTQAQYNRQTSKSASKSVTEAETAEEKPFSGDQDDGKSKQANVEYVRQTSKSAQKSVTEPETTEEKSFWDDQDDGKPKQTKVEYIRQTSKSASKSVTEPETVEERSFWDEQEDGKPKQTQVEYIRQTSKSANKSITEPETVEEKPFWDDQEDGKPKQTQVEYIRQTSKSAKKLVTESETAEEKSFWDDHGDDGKPKQVKVDYDRQSSKTAEKSVTKPESVTENEAVENVVVPIKTKNSAVPKLERAHSIVETIEQQESIETENIYLKSETSEKKSAGNDGARDVQIEEVTLPSKAKKSLGGAETAEDKSIWDENHNERNKKPSVQEVSYTIGKGEKHVTEPEVIEDVSIDVELAAPKRKQVKKESVVGEPMSAETEGRVFETVTTFKSGEDGSIIVSKVSSSRSHGAIITGPAETRTIHKMTSNIYYDDDDDEEYDEFYDRKIIKPNKPHKTSLEVEEIASHSYYLAEVGNYVIPDHIRRGTYGIIEEPQTDSDAESRHSRQVGNRTISIMSVSEDEMSWRNDSLSREISIEDLSKSIFDIDETRKVFSKDSYVRQSSFKEDYITNNGDEESLILREKSEKTFENDITEKLISISKEFDRDIIKEIDDKIDDIRNRLVEELVFEPLHAKDVKNITKDTAETTVEKRKRLKGELFSVEEEPDEDLEALLKRSQRQRSILDDILNEEEEKAPPSLKESSLKDGSVFESLPLVYTVEAVGAPKPTVRWLHGGEEVKQDDRVHVVNEGNLYKLVIDHVDLKDAGKWQCEIVNNLGKQALQAELTVTPVAELRKPIFKTPLEAQRVMQREPVTLQAVCTADPLPHVSWLLNGNLIIPDATIKISEDSKELDHGIKECTFTLQIPTGRHEDTGVYTVQAKNTYGIGESSARLDILLRPEIEPLKDVTAVPYEETTFITKIKANPVAEVKWSKDGYVIQPSARVQIKEDKEAETYQLTVKDIGIADAGVYTVTATNEIGESAQQAKLIVHTDEPVFTKPLQKQTVKDFDDVTLAVRCDGVPKPEVQWYLGGKRIDDDDRHKITTTVEGQVDSQLEIKNFNASDAGQYKVRAVSVSGEAECTAMISLGQSAPGFVHKLDRQRDVDEGEPLELKAKVDGSPMPTAKWYKDGVELSPDDAHVKQTALPDGTVKLSIEHVTPADCGAYKLVISNPNGDYSALCAVAVNPTPRKPSFTQELEDTKAVVGQPLKLEAKVMAFPAPEIKWFKDGLPIRPSQAVNFINQPGGVIGLSIDSCKPEDAGVYTLTLANKLGEAESKAKVEVGQKERKPAFLSQLQPTKVIEGFPLKLEVKVVGHPAPTVKWTLNGKELKPDGTHIRLVSQPDGTHALLIDEARAADAGKYGVILTNDKGEAASEADVTVASRTDDSSPQERPQFIHGLRDVTVEEGQPLAITAPFTGNPVPQVTWTKDGVPLKPSDKMLLTCDGKRVGIEINPMELPDAGVYGIKLVNPLGEDSTDGKITVRKVYQPPRFLQTFSDLQQLPTFDAKFPARVVGIPSPEVTWFKNDIQVRHGDKYNIRRDGDAVCLYVRDLVPEDAGHYKCVATNREGTVSWSANLEVVDKIAKRQKIEPPSFLKKIGDVEVFRGLSAKFTACATGTPDPDVEWFRNDERLYPCERIRMDKESTGLLRLTISGVDPSDVGTYRCRIYNDHGDAECSAQLTYDTLEPQKERKPIAEQYSDFDKMKRTGVPMPLADRPIISRMADRHLTLSWRPSIPHQPRFPVTYQVEMCEVPDGDWFTARTGLRSCVCDIRNLEPFRDYKFRVRVENKYGVSDPSPFAITHRGKLEPDPPKFVPYLEPGIDFRPETSPYFPKDFDIERPPHDGYAQAPKFLRQETDSQYGVKGHNVNLFWFVYGYPKPKMTYFFNDEPIEIGGRYDWSYTRNGQATLFINKMLERDVGWYEAVATNEHGQARQRVRLEVAEYPHFIRRPEETAAMLRRSVRLEARVTGVPYPDIKWYKDWQPLAPSARIKMQFIEPDLVILIINDVITKDEGLYSVSARNVAGAASASAMLHVIEDDHEYADRMREHPPRIKASSKPFGDLYDLGDELGRGVQGVVYHAAERLTGRNYAAKIMHGHSELKPFMRNELDILNHLNDRHLVRLRDAYEREHTLALVLELAAGGELVRDRLLRSSGYTEREIAGYIRQMLRGLHHMHSNSIAHLGLTIGELLLSHAGSDELKLCDFGLSRRIQFNKHAALDYGTPEYVAPEVARGEGVSFAADMWSVGIITYILLSGRSPFRGHNDMETLTRIREGKWDWHDEEWWSRLSLESRDFISKLLVVNWHDRMDVNAALNHPWLNLADKIYKDEYVITTDRLRNYYNLYKDWMSNAQCRTWFRRRPLSGAFEHPSKMVYPPNETYTPEATPEREHDPKDRKPMDIGFKQWDHPDWEVSAKSESHYQNGPDTYLLQLRDTDFPVRLRNYMKVACVRSPGYSLSVHDTYDPRTPIIHERRRFTDIMDEEIDDERRERINNYGTDNYTIRRLRHELGTRLDSYAEAQALMESKKDGQLPFLREKPQVLPIREGDTAQLTCFAVGDPKPTIQWFKNDMVIAEGQRIKIVEDEEGRSTLKFEPAMHHDIGYYKVVARNKVGQTVARTRIVEATIPDAPDSPTASEISDKEVLLRWTQPKYDGNSPVVCYSLQYKEGDSVEWKTVAENIDHEFFVVRDLQPDTSYQFRLSSRNRIGWSDKGIPTNLIKTKQSGAPRIEVTKAMRHLQQITESGQEIVLEEDKPKLDYSTEESPLEWETSQSFTDRYSFVSELWRGKFSIVVKGVDKTTDRVVVAKILECKPETEVQVTREYECLRKLRHERISNLIAAYQSPGSQIAALVQEKLQGADILTYLSSRHDYTEQMVATIVTQILDGLQYLHWRGWCHLDLQPDNVVMASVRSIQVKLIDFGSAHKVTKLGTSVPQVGELEYKAPEIINDEPAYPQTDIWSVGVLAYIMLSGVSPFRGDSPAETKQNISFVRYRFEHLYKEITQEATRFLMWVFKKVPLKRPTAEECHEHRWLATSDFIVRKRERAVFLGNRLKEFSEEYHARKAQEASDADTVGAAFGHLRQLARSNSIQDELLTTSPAGKIFHQQL
ncbi:obscurin-like isoform X3 [Aricia agestis]|uniref:obscurin-like isoform X3 n=1 Tax=Aricia agestis TaxID=91739 RepID=UPI001C20BBBF|nr:obscurin-like isoform X3 [Aricia agestis]